MMLRKKVVPASIRLSTAASSRNKHDLGLDLKADTVVADVRTKCHSRLLEATQKELTVLQKKLQRVKASRRLSCSLIANLYMQLSSNSKKEKYLHEKYAETKSLSIQPERATWCPADENGPDLLLQSSSTAHPQPSLGICSPVTQDRSRQAPSLPSSSLLVPQEDRVEGAGSLPKGKGWWQQSEEQLGCAQGLHSSCPAGLLGTLVETSSQFNLLFSPGAGGNLTLLSCEVTKYFLSVPFHRCLFKQQALKRPTCTSFCTVPSTYGCLGQGP